MISNELENKQFNAVIREVDKKKLAKFREKNWKTK